jgi:uncharacterized protein (DUF433 family)
VSALTDRIFKEIETSPETIQADVLDFVLQAKEKARGTYIRHTPGVCGGEACMRNTRIAVWMLEVARRFGVEPLDLLLDYPNLTAQDLEAAWQYVASHTEEIESAIRANQEA